MISRWLVVHDLSCGMNSLSGVACILPGMAEALRPSIRRTDSKAPAMTKLTVAPSKHP
jgi:hypothetical protein